MQKNVNFGIDVSKYQSNIDWNKVKKAGVNFVIIRIGYRGYGASGTLVQDPMFEEHFTNARNAGLKVGVFLHPGGDRGRGPRGSTGLQLGAERPQAGLPHLL